MPEGPVSREDWTYAHDLVNMYLAVAHMTDNRLADHEKHTLVSKFHEWMPDVAVNQFMEVWDTVTRLYHSLSDPDDRQRTLDRRYTLFLASTANIGEFMSERSDQLLCIIQDLTDIAAADGTLLESESTLIKAAAYAYGLNIDLSVDERTGEVKLAFTDLD